MTMMDEVIKDLINQAEAENWDEIDREIPDIVKNKDYVNWAYSTALSYANGNVRDLGVSILEKAAIEENEFAQMRDRLYNKMLNDSNIYVRFRSAFALAAHGPGKYKKKVISVLKSALKDDDVKDFAEKYIKQLME
jgi:hypothetical protein